MLDELDRTVVRQIGDGRDLRCQPQTMTSEESERRSSRPLDHKPGKLGKQILTVAQT
jgi:hypothetical protein